VRDGDGDEPIGPNMTEKSGRLWLRTPTAYGGEEQEMIPSEQTHRQTCPNISQEKVLSPGLAKRETHKELDFSHSTLYHQETCDRHFGLPKQRN
jgi:hypothetical protein